MTAFVMVGLAGARAAAWTADLPGMVWLPYPAQGIELGQGYDLLEGRPASAVCIDFFVVQDGGLEVRYDITEVNTFASTFSSFGVSASGALKMALLKGSASLAFANKVRTSSTGQTFAVTARLRQGARFVSPVPSTKAGSDTVSEARVTSGAITFNGDYTSVGVLNQCGSGYVSAILSGGDLLASVDTASSTSKEESSFNGKINFEILGGLISGDGSVNGASDEETRISTARVGSSILGGKSFTLPTTVEGLRDFVQNLPEKIAPSPRPVMIAVTPYSTVETGSIFDGFENATTLKPALFAFFAAREAADRLSYAIEMQQMPKKGSKAVVMPSEQDLFTALDIAYNAMIALRHGLDECEATLADQNRKRERKAVENLAAHKSASDGAGRTAAFFADAEKIAAEDRRAAAAALVKAIGPARSSELPPIEPDEESEETGQTAEKSAAEATENSEILTNANCLTGLAATQAISQAKVAFLYSLYALPLYPDDLLHDPSLAPKESADAKKEVHDLAKKLRESTALADLAKYTAEIRDGELKAYQKCWAEGMRRLKEEGKLGSIDPHSPLSLFEQMIGEKPTLELTASCEKKREAWLEQMSPELKGLKGKVKDVKETHDKLAALVARHVYRAHFYPVRKALCETDLGPAICAMSYREATAVLAEYIRFDSRNLAALINAFAVEATEKVEPKVEDTTAKPLPYPFPNFNCGPGTIYSCP